MTAGTLARRYATALMQLADEQGKLEAVSKSLSELLEAWEGSQELRDVFENPAVGAEQRRAVLNGLSDKLGLPDIVVHTLLLLSDRRRMRHFPEIVEAYRTLAEQREGRIRAEVITAHPLSDSYFEQLRQTLERVTGKKVTIVKKQDEALIAGVVTRVGDKVFDGSLRNRLDELKENLLA